MSRKRNIWGLVLAMLALYAPQADAKNILIYGDSLSAAYGLELEQGWGHLLAKRLGAKHALLNASVSGETSAGGLARLAVTLDEFPADLVLLELGANDGLRGYPVAQLEENLTAMIAEIVRRGGEVLVFGITVPPSYGPRYIESFEAVYEHVAKITGQHYFNFVVERFIGNERYIQGDGLHPTAAAQPEIEKLVFDYLNTNHLLD